MGNREFSLERWVTVMREHKYDKLIVSQQTRIYPSMFLLICMDKYEQIYPHTDTIRINHKQKTLLVVQLN